MQATQRCKRRLCFPQGHVTHRHKVEISFSLSHVTHCHKDEREGNTKLGEAGIVAVANPPLLGFSVDGDTPILHQNCAHIVGRVKVAHLARLVHGIHEILDLLMMTRALASPSLLIITTALPSFPRRNSLPVRGKT